MQNIRFSKQVPNVRQAASGGSSTPLRWVQLDVLYKEFTTNQRIVVQFRRLRIPQCGESFSSTSFFTQRFNPCASIGALGGCLGAWGKSSVPITAVGI